MHKGRCWMFTQGLFLNKSETKVTFTVYRAARWTNFVAASARHLDRSWSNAHKQVRHSSSH